ncbi:conserved hypothetical protein [Aspergillus terreus NIH2624]|uniref:Uncharacterized protein n=1 Tax=Aspergillus terreus (strain NIH 2624 / FGSC A1156) TaxID=341663 RepID=Q0CYD1_ASPTN|nr:uncharacterized protein ATEG_01303 [Aspergillus terreus NIH2624]EAU38060.1 conserved hypothetical protein [Aspergillus terreus NIH2624]
MDLMSATQRYTNTLKSLSASNEMLDTKIKELCSNTLRLRLDLMKFQHHMNGFNREFLVTWQADTLTRLIEVIYEGHGWRLPGGVTSRDHGVVNRERMSMMYGIAARKLKKETLRALGLYERYYEALQKYDEITPFRSANPFQSECSFARWLVSKKDTQAEVYRFWGGLFPLCYGRTVEEASEIF